MRSRWSRSCSSCAASPGDDPFGRGGPRDDNGLLRQARPDPLRQGRVDAGRVLAQLAVDPGPAHRPQPGRAAGLGQQVQHGGVADVAPQRLLQAGMDLREQRPQPVVRRRGLREEVIVVAQQHRQVRPRLVGHVQSSQRMRRGHRRVRDDERIPRVGLRTPRMQVRQPPHRQPWQVRHVDAHRLRDGHRQRSDRMQLVDHDQHLTLGRNPTEQLPQRGLGVRDLTVDQAPSLRIQRDRVMHALADIQTDDDVVTHGDLLAPPPGQHGVGTRQPRYGKTHTIVGHVPISGPPTPPGPVTALSRSSTTRAMKSCQARQPGAPK